MDNEKKTEGLKFTAGSCLSGVALLLAAAVWLENNGQRFGVTGYEGLKGFGQLFLGVVVLLLAAFVVFALGSALYQYLLSGILNKWKITSYPFVKAMIICLITAALIWGTL